MALLDPGDEAIVFEPFYGYHVNTLQAMHAQPVYVRLSPPDWNFTRAGLERVVTAKTRVIVLNTPANPSGKVFTREELEWITALARERDLFIFTDEIYEYFLYDVRQHISMASLPGLRDRTISICHPSKTFSTNGRRLRFAA